MLLVCCRRRRQLGPSTCLVSSARDLPPSRWSPPTGLSRTSVRPPSGPSGKRKDASSQTQSSRASLALSLLLSSLSLFLTLYLNGSSSSDIKKIYLFDGVSRACCCCHCAFLAPAHSPRAQLSATPVKRGERKVKLSGAGGIGRQGPEERLAWINAGGQWHLLPSMFVVAGSSCWLRLVRVSVCLLRADGMTRNSIGQT